MIIGLTGGIATGKSTISDMFKSVGIPVVDTDIIARNVVGINKKAYLQIIEYFGKEIIQANGKINRKKLGKIIFKDEIKREALNNIVHPQVRLETIAKIDEYKTSGHKIIVIDVPLLFESGFDDLCDYTIVVYTDDLTQISRLMKRDNIDEGLALKKINAQMPLSEKISKADFLIDNSNSITDTNIQFKHILEKLQYHY